MILLFLAGVLNLFARVVAPTPKPNGFERLRLCRLCERH